MSLVSRTLVLPAVLAACYTYTPLSTARPVPANQVSLRLTDEGSAAAGPTLGYGIDRVAGTLLRSTDSTLVLRVAGASDVRGVQSKWNGEEVALRRAWVARITERHFSRSRTYAAAGALTAGVAAFLATRAFNGGGTLLQNGGGGGGGNNQ